MGISSPGFVVDPDGGAGFFYERLLPRSRRGRRWVLAGALVALTILVASLWARWDEDKAIRAAKDKARDKTAEYLESIAPK